MVAFTASKLQVFGANLARALIVQHSLGPMAPWTKGRRDEGTKGRREGKIMLTIEDRCRGLCESLEGFDMFRYVSIIRDALRQINGSKNSRCALQLQRHPRIQYTHVYTQ